MITIPNITVTYLDKQGKAVTDADLYADLCAELGDALAEILNDHDIIDLWGNTPVETQESHARYRAVMTWLDTDRSAAAPEGV